MKRTVILAVILALFLFIVSCGEETKVIVGEEEAEEVSIEEEAPAEEEAAPEEEIEEEAPAEEEEPEEGAPSILVPDYDTIDTAYMATPVEVDGTTIRIMKYEAKKVDGDAYIWGMVENLGEKEAKNIVVFGYFFYKHAIVNKTYAYVEGKNIPPGEAKKFEIVVPNTEFEAYFIFPGQG